MSTDYIAIDDVELDPLDPGVTGLWARLRDNALAIIEGGSNAPAISPSAFASSTFTAAMLAADVVDTLQIVDGDVTTAKLDTASVTQDKLSTTPAVDMEANNTIAPGATWQVTEFAGIDYGFYPQIYSIRGPYSAHIALECSVTTLATSLSIVNPSATQEIIAVILMRAVEACPPYDMGDGDVPLFFFAEMGADGPLRSFVAQDPPWAHGGPNNVKPDFRIDGKQFKYQKRRPCTLKEAIKNPKLMDAYRESLHAGEWGVVEIDRAYKNRDMHLRPHPFGNTSKPVILIDPVSRMAEDLALLRASGVRVADLLANGMIEFGNTPLARCVPPGVMAVDARWKNSKG